jgi:hypothetical protein
MYNPPLFKEDRIEVMHDAIRATGLATLVTQTTEGLIASHVPLLLDPQPAPYGTLIGHLARLNPQARGALGRGASDLPGPGRLYHPFLVRDQAPERQGRADLELCCYPCPRRR